MVKEAPPPIPEKMRIPLRIGAAILAYVLYRVLLDEKVIPPVFIAFGALLVAGTLIDRWTLRRRETSGLLQVGTTILGLGLLGIGIYLYLR